jgi:hypothetical protein
VLGMDAMTRQRGPLRRNVSQRGVGMKPVPSKRRSQQSETSKRRLIAKI